MALLLATLGSSNAIVVNSANTLADASALAADVAAYPAFAATGVVQIQEGASSYLGTGVLVAPDWVLTAAHNWDTGAVTALSFRIDGETYTAQAGQWFQNPQWVSNPNVSLLQGSDIALFHLDRSVTGINPVTLYTGDQELGAGIVVIGAGLCGTSTTGPRSNPSSTLYAASNTIDRVLTLTNNTSTGGLLAFDFDDGTATHNSLAGSAVYDTTGKAVNTVEGGDIASLPSTAFALTLEGTTAPGDSGGPAFADFGNGLQLIGLVSWGVNPTNPSNLYGSGLGDITYLTRVSTFDEWILATIPEPSTGLLLIAGLFLITVRRNLRKH